MKKPKAIFISSHLPVPKIPVAGQKIAYSNLKLLCDKYDIILISFINEIEKKYFEDSLYKMCYATHFFDITIKNRIKNILFHLDKPVRVSSRYIHEITSLINTYLENTSIDLFHAEYTASMSYVDLFLNTTLTEVVEHDIVYQSLERYCINKKFPSKLMYCFEAKKQKKWEIAQLKKFNNIVVLNEKDKSLLEKEAISNISVAFPKVEDWCYSVSRNSIEPYSILFLGAMNRFENQDAILWFVKNIFTNIQTKYSNVKLYIVGGNPPDKIKNLACSNIEVTGFVDSLQIYFEKAHIAIVPLRYGAGIKIKTLETLAAKIPTIATTIGAEGIPQNKNLIIIDNEELFGTQINTIFEDFKQRNKK